MEGPDTEEDDEPREAGVTALEAIAIRLRAKKAEVAALEAEVIRLRAEVAESNNIIEQIEARLFTNEPCKKRADKDFEEIREHLMCSICIDQLKKPLVLLCGHHFCRGCIKRWLYPDELQCPRRNPKCPYCLSPTMTTTITTLGSLEAVMQNRLSTEDCNLVFALCHDDLDKLATKMSVSLYRRDQPHFLGGSSEKCSCLGCRIHELIKLVHEALRYSKNHITLDEERFDEDLRKVLEQTDEERLVQIFTELTLNDCCNFGERSHRFCSSLFYEDAPALQGWTNTNYMERVAAALRVNIVEFVKDGKPEIGDSPIARVALHSLFTTPVNNWIFISTRYNTSEETLQPHQRRIDHRKLYGFCQRFYQYEEYSHNRESQRLSHIMTDADGIHRDNIPFMLDNKQVRHALGEMWNLERNANDSSLPMIAQDEYVKNHCHQHCYSADWQKNQRTLNTITRVTKRALNDNNVLRALLTLPH